MMKATGLSEKTVVDTHHSNAFFSPLEMLNIYSGEQIRTISASSDGKTKIDNGPRRHSERKIRIKRRQRFEILENREGEMGFSRFRQMPDQVLVGGIGPGTAIDDKNFLQM